MRSVRNLEHQFKLSRMWIQQVCISFIHLVTQIFLILLCKAATALSACKWTEVWSLTWPLLDINIVVLKPFLCGFGFIFRVSVMLESSSSPTLQYLCRLLQLFLQIFHVIYSSPMCQCPQSLTSKPDLAVFIQLNQVGSSGHFTFDADLDSQENVSLVVMSVRIFNPLT